MTHLPECTCPLIDISSFRKGLKPEYILGNPRGSGCPIHETQAMRDEIKAAEHEARHGERASGGPISAGSTYWLGEHGPEPLIVPHAALDPKFAAWLSSRDYQLHVRNVEGNWIQTWPPPEPPKRAWWEYRWPPLVMSIAAMVIGIITIINAFGE